ncbi:MAG: hypothetical protein QM652_10835 [Legionella sp.]|uniref:hypothetical protein n=1 Tax=Legionella sp. TaxID=459 RepID=UPI0039E31DC7
MSDPFPVLKEALQTVFLLETIRNKKYFYPEIQQLKDSLDNFNYKQKDFIQLLTAIRAASTRIKNHIKKGHIDFETIRTSIDSLAKILNRPIINLDDFLSKPNVSPKFFNVLKEEIDLLPWLTKQSRSNVSPNDINSQMHALWQCKALEGFSSKLRAHLNKDPDFLARLIRESEKNFIQIASTDLILYLTDRQLAEAIIKHIPKLVENGVHAKNLIDKLNEILSHGRSVSTLCRSTDAKSILESSNLLQMDHKTDDLKVNTATTSNPPSSVEENGLKPVF